MPPGTLNADIRGVAPQYACNFARNAEIVRRRRAGEWPRAIARSLGLSHNVVIGVCNRAGLSGPAGHAETLRGEETPNSKLTEGAVAALRRDYVPGVNRWRRGNLAELAVKYGVSATVAWLAVRRKTWKHVA